MIADFPIPSGQNIGGMYFFQFIESRFVVSIPQDQQLIISIAPPLVGSSVWKRGYNTLLTLSWNQQAIDDPSRPKYKQELVGFCPEFNATLEYLFSEMIYERYVLDCFDNQNKRILVGSPDNGMHFEWKFTTHPDAKGRKGYAYRFFRESDISAYFLSYTDGVVDGDGSGGPGGGG